MERKINCQTGCIALPDFYQKKYLYGFLLTEEPGSLSINLWTPVIWGVELGGVGREMILLFSLYLLCCAVTMKMAHFAN